MFITTLGLAVLTLSAPSVEPAPSGNAPLVSEGELVWFDGPHMNAVGEARS